MERARELEPSRNLAGRVPRVAIEVVQVTRSHPVEDTRGGAAVRSADQRLASDNFATGEADERLDSIAELQVLLGPPGGGARTCLSARQRAVALRRPPGWHAISRVRSRPAACALSPEGASRSRIPDQRSR